MPLSTNQQPFIYRALIIYTVDIPEYVQTEYTIRKRSADKVHLWPGWRLLIDWFHHTRVTWVLDRLQVRQRV